MQSTKEDKELYTLAESLDFIASEVKNNGLDKFLLKEHDECRYICEKMQITPLQAALFATILEESDDELASTKDLMQHMKISKIRFLGYKQDLDELTKKRLVVARLVKKGGVGYRVSRAIVSAVQNNSSVKPEKLEGLSTKAMFTRFHSIFSDIVNNITSPEIAIQEIFDIMNHNKKNPFVKATRRWGVHTLDSKEEVFLFIYMLHRIVSFSKEKANIDEFTFILDDALLDHAELYDALRSNETSLQENGLLEFVCDNGLEDNENFRVPQSVVEEMLGDLNLNDSKLKANIPKNELIRHTDIIEKKMFYNADEEQQINRLRELLAEEKFAQVKARLKEKGMRGGFCCLFYGAAGTGKTESVMQIARETGRDIFIVDMSKIRSKWVGESEKNIKRLFNLYRNIQASCKRAPILLFNEADAIFSKRVEIADDSSSGTMNNTIQNIILQEMENLEGILIATTNLTKNFDSAFERRFLYKVLFNSPTQGVKAKIWRSMVEEITEDDASRLAADYNFTGGQIENISRKLNVEYIITGETPDLNKIIDLCKAEKIVDGNGGGRIGFTL